MSILKRFFNNNSNASEQQAISPLEVGGAIDAFISLEEIAPDVDWTDALAASWGLPYTASEIA